MNKCFRFFLVCAVMAFVGCGGNKNNKSTSESVNTSKNNTNECVTTIANPWIITDLQGIEKLCGRTLTLPDGVSDVVYTQMQRDTLGQARFQLDGNDYTVRIKKTQCFQDFSGVYVDWKTQDSCVVKKCRGIERRGIYDGKVRHVILLQDVTDGYMYSISASGDNLDSKMVKSVAEIIVEN